MPERMHVIAGLVKSQPVKHWIHEDTKHCIHSLMMYVCAYSNVVTRLITTMRDFACDGHHSDFMLGSLLITHKCIYRNKLYLSM